MQGLPQTSAVDAIGSSATFNEYCEVRNEAKEGRREWLAQ